MKWKCYHPLKKKHPAHFSSRVFALMILVNNYWMVRVALVE
jgi:hypothetical protein